MRQVEPAVDADLHAAGAGGFERAARVVEPDVDALHQVAGDVDVVVFEEDHAAAELGPAADVDDLGDQLLAAVVARMRLAGEDELHGPILVVDDRGQAFEVAEDQRAALVGGEAAGEADGQRLGVEHLLGAGDLGRRRAAALELASQPAAGEGDEPLAAALVRAPQLVVGDVLDPLPDRCDRSGRSSHCTPR